MLVLTDRCLLFGLPVVLETLSSEVPGRPTPKLEAGEDESEQGQREVFFEERG